MHSIDTALLKDNTNLKQNSATGSTQVMVGKDAEAKAAQSQQKAEVVATNEVSLNERQLAAVGTKNVVFKGTNAELQEFLKALPDDIESLTIEMVKEGVYCHISEITDLTRFTKLQKLELPDLHASVLMPKISDTLISIKVGRIGAGGVLLRLEDTEYPNLQHLKVKSVALQLVLPKKNNLTSIQIGDDTGTDINPTGVVRDGHVDLRNGIHLKEVHIWGVSTWSLLAVRMPPKEFNRITYVKISNMISSTIDLRSCPPNLQLEKQNVTGGTISMPAKENPFITMLLLAIVIMLLAKVVSM